MPATDRPLRIAVIGLGTVGRAVAAAVQAEASTTLAGLIEVNDDVRRRTADGLAVSAGDGAVIGDDPEALSDVDVGIVCTSPLFDRIAPTLRRLMKRKMHVVAACAEATWPWLRHPHLADVLAGEARAAGVAVLGGDVYPGFGWWRSLPRRGPNVKLVTIRRSAVLDGRRASVLRRCALGKTMTRFTALARQNLVGQPGVGESVVVIAQSLGRHPMRGQIATTVVPIPAEAAVDSPFGRIEPGHVAGVRQRAAYQDDDLNIEMELTFVLPPAEPVTTLELDSAASVHAALPDDTSPAALATPLIDAARQIGRLPPGLRTVIDLP